MITRAHTLTESLNTAPRLARRSCYKRWYGNELNGTRARYNGDPKTLKKFAIVEKTRLENITTGYLRYVVHAQRKVTQHNDNDNNNTSMTYVRVSTIMRKNNQTIVLTNNDPVKFKRFVKKTKTKKKSNK